MTTVLRIDSRVTSLMMVAREYDSKHPGPAHQQRYVRPPHPRLPRKRLLNRLNSPLLPVRIRPQRASLRNDQRPLPIPGRPNPVLSPWRAAAPSCPTICTISPVGSCGSRSFTSIPAGDANRSTVS